MFQKMGIHDPASIIFEIKAIKSLHDLFFLRELEGGESGDGGGGKWGWGWGGRRGNFYRTTQGLCIFHKHFFI